MLVINEFKHGVPVAIIISEKEDAATLGPVLAAFRDEVRAVEPGNPHWSPSCFLVDDDTAEHNAIQ